MVTKSESRKGSPAKMERKRESFLYFLTIKKPLICRDIAGLDLMLSASPVINLVTWKEFAEASRSSKVKKLGWLKINR